MLLTFINLIFQIEIFIYLLCACAVHKWVLIKELSHCIHLNRKTDDVDFVASYIIVQANFCLLILAFYPLFLFKCVVENTPTIIRNDITCFSSELAAFVSVAFQLVHEFKFYELFYTYSQIRFPDVFFKSQCTILKRKSVCCFRWMILCYLDKKLSN